jgi:hypothetical protein
VQASVLSCSALIDVPAQGKENYVGLMGAKIDFLIDMHLLRKCSICGPHFPHEGLKSWAGNPFTPPSPPLGVSSCCQFLGE